MRSFIVMGMFVASLGSAAWQEHLKVRELQLSAEGDVRIDDGSGSISVRNVGNIRIDDGSGSIGVTAADGGVSIDDGSIDDGSGGITVVTIGGSVTIDDGSGEIKVSDVERDLIIVDDGSGGLSVSDVRGNVRKNRS